MTINFTQLYRPLDQLDKRYFMVSNAVTNGGDGDSDEQERTQINAPC